MAGPSHSPSAQGTVARLGLIGGVIVIATVAAVALGGQSKAQGYLAYLFLLGGAPLLAASLLFMARNRPWLLERLVPALQLFLVLVLAGSLALGGVEYANRSLLSTSWPFFAVVLVSALVAAILNLPRRRSRRLPYLSDPVRRTAVLSVLDVLLVALLVAFTIFFGRFYPAGHPGVPFASDFVIYAWETPHFASWLGLGLLVTCAALWLWRFQDRASVRTKRLLDRLALAGTLLFVLSLFDDGLFINLPHLMVYVGPAMHALHGGIPMVDIYCIYGLLPWFIIRTAFELLGPTFGAAALAVGIVKLVTLGVMVLVLYTISRRRLAAMILMVAAVQVAVTLHPGVYNLNALPSTTGMRYIVPTLMVLVLAAVRSPAWSRWIGAALLALASVWGVEALTYSLAPWGYVLLLQAIRERSVRNAGLTLLVGIAAMVLAHATFGLATFLATGKTIDYVPYFGQFLRFRPDSEPGNFWQAAFDPNFEVWVPIWLGHFLVLSVAGYSALRGRPPTDMASRLAPVAAYGLATLNYYMALPTWLSLGWGFLPVAIELICVLEVLAINPRKYGTIGVAILLALVTVSSAMAAFGTERFARPMESNLGNHTVLRRCFSAEGCQLAEIPVNLRRHLNAAAVDPDGPVARHLFDTNPDFAPIFIQKDGAVGWQSIVEAADILKRWAPDQRRVALLADNLPNPYVSLTALIQTGQWYRWPISSPLNDEISEPLVALILRRVAEDSMQDGEIVVVSNDRANLLQLQQKILDIVTARCRLALLEKREFHSVYRTEACGAAAAQ